MWNPRRPEPGLRGPIVAAPRRRAVRGTVVVKLRSNPAVVRRFEAAAGLRTAALARPRVLALIENGYVAEAKPVFPAPLPLSRTRGMERAFAAAAAPTPTQHALRRSQSLLCLTLERGIDAADVAEHLRSLGDEVEYAYVPPVKYLLAPPKARRKKTRRRLPLAETSDPMSARQWNHGAVQIYAARDRAGFKDAAAVLVAVVDSGIDQGHPDLDGAIAEYRNFHSDTEDDRDVIGHGTHVSGIIAAETNNEIGVAGLCAARILAVKGLPSGNAWFPEKYYRALAYSIERGAKVLNLSLGGGLDPGERDVIADLLDAGVSVIAAMGNEFDEGNPIEYPAAYDGVVAVGASDELDRRASFSNTGPHIALVAPGERILSTVPRYPSRFAATTDYDSWPGTSMATPHVAAAAALLLAKHPSHGPRDVRRKLLESADRVPGQTAWNEEFGAGRLNIQRLLQCR